MEKIMNFLTVDMDDVINLNCGQDGHLNLIRIANVNLHQTIQ
jgi:hypothetical protein